MKRIYFLFFMLIIVFKATAINDYNKLEETINYFGKTVMLGKELPESFKISYSEFEKLAIIESPNISKERLDEQFEYLKQKNVYQYRNLVEIADKVDEIIDFDTLTYVSNGVRLINISIVYELTKKLRKKKEPNTKRIIARFMIIGNELKFAQMGKMISELHFNHNELELLKDLRSSEFHKKYKRYAFFTSIDKNVPYQSDGKLGLQSLIDNKSTEAIYDTILPYYNGFACIVLNGKYNLIDVNRKQIFDTWQQNITLNKSNYQILNSQGEYVSFNGDPSVLNMKEEEESEIIMEERTMPSTNSSKRKEISKAKALKDSLTNFYYHGVDIDVKQGNNYSKPYLHYVIEQNTNDTILTLNGYNYIGTFGNYLRGKLNEELIVMNLQGEVLFKTQFISIGNSPGYMDIYDRENRLFGMYCPYTNVYIEPKYYYIRPIDRDSFFVVITKDGKFGYLDEKGNELFD